MSRLIEVLSIEPKQGTSLGNNCYKIRLELSSKAKGKSGGARVIAHVHIMKKNIFLLSIFDKSDAENISNKEILLLIRSLG